MILRCLFEYYISSVIVQIKHFTAVRCTYCDCASSACVANVYLSRLLYRVVQGTVAVYRGVNGRRRNEVSRLLFL